MEPWVTGRSEARASEGGWGGWDEREPDGTDRRRVGEAGVCVWRGQGPVFAPRASRLIVVDGRYTASRVKTRTHTRSR